MFPGVTEGSARRISSHAADPDGRRLIEWTGERCVPWVQDSAMLYEHFHRYLWAAQIVMGHRVLDVGSGEGFGAAILAESAASVVGIDLDAAAVAHAAANYSQANLTFEQASATDLSRFADASFTVVIAFEMIEHVGDQERVILEVDRVLTADGIVLISTPDRELYGKASGRVNAFHERELSLAEFRSLLATRFEHVDIWGQRTITGSYLSALDPPDEGRCPPTSDFLVRRSAQGGLQRMPSSEPIFCVALASNRPLPALARSSTLADEGLELVHETARAYAGAVEERERLLGEVHQQLARVNLLYGEKHEEVVALSRALGSVEAQLLETGDRLNAAEASLALIEQSVSWQMLQRARAAYRGVVGERSLLARSISRALRLVGRLLARSRD